MNDQANDLQSRVIAKQLFDTWKAEQELESDRAQGFLGGSWPTWAALILSIGAIIWAGGGQQRQNDEQDRRLDAIEDRQLQQATDAQQVLQRLASIEAKLDLITEERRK